LQRPRASARGPRRLHHQHDVIAGLRGNFGGVVIGGEAGIYGLTRTAMEPRASRSP
jgi:hypothetical protein